MSLQKRKTFRRSAGIEGSALLVLNPQNRFRSNPIPELKEMIHDYESRSLVSSPYGSENNLKARRNIAELCEGFFQRGLPVILLRTCDYVDQKIPLKEKIREMGKSKFNNQVEPSNPKPQESHRLKPDIVSHCHVNPSAGVRRFVLGPNLYRFWSRDQTVYPGLMNIQWGADDFSFWPEIKEFIKKNTFQSEFIQTKVGYDPFLTSIDDNKLEEFLASVETIESPMKLNLFSLKQDMPLEDKLNAWKINRLYICGGLSHLCLESTIRAAVLRGFEVHLASEAVFSMQLHTCDIPLRQRPRGENFETYGNSEEKSKVETLKTCFFEVMLNLVGPSVSVSEIKRLLRVTRLDTAMQYKMNGVWPK